MKKFSSETEMNRYGFISLKNKPSKEDLKEYYEEHYFTDEKLRPQNYQNSYDEKELSHIELMNELCFFGITKSIQKEESDIKVLEVGVGEGFTLSKILEKGCKVSGIDFRDEGIKKFNPKLLKYVEIGNAIEILDKYIVQKRDFDVIIMRFMLEHVLEPYELLENLKKLLKKDGVLVITIPNDYSITQIRAKKNKIIDNEFWVTPPEHVNFFNIESFRNFSTKVGFRILEMYSSFPIDFFLFHPGSNFITKKENGKDAHKARVELELLMSEAGIENYYNLCKSQAMCNIGRTFTSFMKMD